MISALRQSVGVVSGDPKAQLAAVGVMIYLPDWLPQNVQDIATWVGVAVALSLLIKNLFQSRKIYLENKILQDKVDSQDLPSRNRRHTDKVDGGVK